MGADRMAGGIGRLRGQGGVDAGKGLVIAVKSGQSIGGKSRDHRIGPEPGLGGFGPGQQLIPGPMPARQGHRLQPQHAERRGPLQCIAQTIERLLTAAQLRQQAGHCGMGLNQFGLDPNRLTVSVKRLVKPASVSQQMPAHRCRFRETQSFGPGALDLIQRLTLKPALTQLDG